MNLRFRSLRQVVHDTEHGWTPLFSLVYLVFFFLQPFLEHTDAIHWIFYILGGLIFIALYLGIFLVEGTIPILHVCGMVLLGVVFLPSTESACTFFIYAASISPFVVRTQRAGVIWLFSIAGLGAAESLLLKHGGWGLFFCSIFPVFIGGGNIFFAERNRMNRRLRRANEEVEHLAKVAERERIARDLHDVLGHTLSVIILKSELAGKLIERDPARAGDEIREVETISRQALSEVRDAIRGYRSEGLAAELARAKATLETAGLTVQCDAATTVKLPAVQESVLSLAVREAVTNVVRHAQARTCKLRVEQQNGSCRLEILDDGKGGASLEGNGLRGMRERVEMLGGTLNRETESGTKLTITLPLKESRAESRTQ